MIRRPAMNDIVTGIVTLPVSQLPVNRIVIKEL